MLAFGLNEKTARFFALKARKTFAKLFWADNCTGELWVTKNT